MAIERKLSLVFMFFYLSVLIYLLLFLTIPEIKELIMQLRRDIAKLTEGTNYFWALLISLLVCLIGNASIGFPVPFPFVLFSFSNAIYLRYSNKGLAIGEILTNTSFWIEITGIALAGGLGSALGEITSYLLGRGAKAIVEKSEQDSKVLQNIEGFGKFILDHPKQIFFYVFIAALLPIPDDPLWIALGMAEKKYSLLKLVIAGWLGKSITCFFYVLLPILIILGFSVSGIELNDESTVVTETIMLLITLTIMLFILAFNWNKLLENRRKTLTSSHNNYLPLFTKNY
jgi:membrane protein YqaA with SNARE-associated domain